MIKPPQILLLSLVLILEVAAAAAVFPAPGVSMTNSKPIELNNNSFDFLRLSLFVPNTYSEKIVTNFVSQPCYVRGLTFAAKPFCGLFPNQNPC